MNIRIATTATRIASASRRPRLNSSMARAEISASIGVLIFAPRESGLLRLASALLPADFAPLAAFAGDFVLRALLPSEEPLAVDRVVARVAPRVVALVVVWVFAAVRFFRVPRFCETALVVNAYPMCGDGSCWYCYYYFVFCRSLTIASLTWQARQQIGCIALTATELTVSSDD